MSLTLPDKYTATARINGSHEDWFIRLYDVDDNYIGLSFRDLVIGGVQYYGVIQEIDDIYHSIDLKKNISSLQSVNIFVLDKWKSGTLSGELFKSGNCYINRTVIIYSVLSLNTPTALTDGIEIYRGKFKGIKDVSNGQLTLVIEQDIFGYDKKIPDTKSDKSIYYPVAYGDFVESTTTAFDQSKLYPCPQNTGTGWYDYSDNEPNMYYLTTNDVSASTGPSIFISAQNGFIDYYSSGKGANYFYIGAKLDCNGIIRPVGENEDYPDNGEFSNPENAYDYWDDSTYDTSYAEFTDTGVSGGSLNTVTFRLNMPLVHNRMTSCKVYYKIALTISNFTYDPGEDLGGETFVDINDDTGGYSSYTMADWSYADEGGTFLSWVENSVFNSEQQGVNSEYAENDHITASDMDYVMPHISNLYVGYKCTGEGNSYDISVKVYDMYYLCEFAETYSDLETKKRALERLEAIKYVFCGVDGLTQSYSGGSGIASLPHEIHRDLLARYTEFDQATIEGWSDLNTYRTTPGCDQDWEFRLWQLEPRLLIEILEQIQFEGCFIFYLRPGGSGRYIFIKNTYSSADFTFTDNDYTDLEISLTEVHQLETKNTYNYWRHRNPEIGSYMKTRTYTNSTNRILYNIGTNENLITYNLDYAGSDCVYNSAQHTNPNDCIALYRNNLWGSVKPICKFKLINKQYWGVECGDIFKISSNIYTLFGYTWANAYFMITEIKRKINEIKVKGMMVYYS